MKCRDRCRFARLLKNGRPFLAGALALALVSCQAAPDGDTGTPGSVTEIDLPAAQSAPLRLTGSQKGGKLSDPTKLTRKPLGELAPLPDSLEAKVEEPQIFRGTGVLARQPRGRHVDVKIIEDGDITLNFANAEIREVVDAVLGQALGLSYIIDPRVQGEVTARTSQPIPRTAVIPALENILALNGAALTLDNGIYKVVTLQQAATQQKHGIK